MLAPLMICVASLAALPAWPLPGAPAPPSALVTQKDKDEAAALEARARSASATLKKALASNDPLERRAALSDASEVVHPRVIKAMAKALDDRDPEVVGQVIVHFGNMRHPEALKALRSHARRAAKKLKSDTPLRVALLRSIGLHANPSQVNWLLEGVFDEKERYVRRAKVFGVARTRSVEAVEALLHAMSKQDSKRLRSTQLELRTSLIWMTGTDQGDSPDAWQRWWRENRKGFKVPEKTPKLRGQMLEAWAGFWDEDIPYERPKRRGDRG